MLVKLCSAVVSYQRYVVTPVHINIVKGIYMETLKQKKIHAEQPHTLRLRSYTLRAFTSTQALLHIVYTIYK